MQKRIYELKISVEKHEVYFCWSKNTADYGTELNKHCRNTSRKPPSIQPQAIRQQVRPVEQSGRRSVNERERLVNEQVKIVDCNWCRALTGLNADVLTYMPI